MKPLPSRPSPGGGRRSHLLKRIRDNAVLYGVVLTLCTLSCLAGVSLMTVTAIGVCTEGLR